MVIPSLTWSMSAGERNLSCSSMQLIMGTASAAGWWYLGWPGWVLTIVLWPLSLSRNQPQLGKTGHYHQVSCLCRNPWYWLLALSRVISGGGCLLRFFAELWNLIFLPPSCLVFSESYWVFIDVWPRSGLCLAAASSQSTEMLRKYSYAA